MRTADIPATNTATRAGGMWLAAASLVMIAAIGLHGPIPVEMDDRMISIAGRSTAWTVAHWIAAAGLSMFAMAGLMVLTAGSRLTGRGGLTAAWTVVTVGALWTLTTAVAEATAVTSTAIAGNAELFATWWSFAEGRANGFAALNVAVAVIAREDARSPDGVTPAWAAHTGSLAGILAFVSWALGMWFGVALGNVLWVAASILMSVWTLWFGIGLMRRRESAWATA